jgi:hypothetical protein
MAGRGGARKRVADRSADESDPNFDQDYAEKRKRNNEAVNKTRQKKRQEEQDTAKKVEELRKENANLEKYVLIKSHIGWISCILTLSQISTQLQSEQKNRIFAFFGEKFSKNFFRTYL